MLAHALDWIAQHAAAFWHQLDQARVLMLVLGGSAVLVTALEGLLINRLKPGERYDWGAFWTTVRINGWRTVVEAIPMGVVLGASIPFGLWFYEHRIIDWSGIKDTWWGLALMWLAMFLVLEFFYYWLHRAGHRVRWYWASHQVHHSGNQYNLAAAFRQSITGKVTGAFVFFAPQCWFGFSPAMVATAYGINLAYQFWIHTDLVPKLGWMEGIFNTPSAHRVHHAANVEYLDANYGGTLMLFDRLFGTYVPEKDGVPIRYGLVKQVTTYSAIKICLFEWANLLRDAGGALLRGHSLDALGYLFMPPGWAPNGQGLTTEGLRAQMQSLTGAPAGVPPEQLLAASEQVIKVSASPAQARPAT